MEKKLRRLFDYQKFALNKELQRQIDDVLNKETSCVLSDDMLGAVAGGVSKDEDIKDIEKKND